MNAPYLYQYIDSEVLTEMLDTFYSCLGLSIQAIDSNGKPLISCGGEAAFCKIFENYLPETTSCEQFHMKSCRQAINLGEVYLFSCHANLNHIVFPFMKETTLLGAVLVGPFLMIEPDSLLLSDLEKHYKIPTEALLELYEASNEIKVIAPSNVTKISKLLYYMFSGLFPDSRQFLKSQQTSLYQQSRINESIQMYKEYGVSSSDPYPYEKEKELITKVRTGNIQQARQILNDLLGYVFFSKGSNLEAVKTRSIELCSLLSRAAIESGASADNILKINDQYLRALQKIHTMEKLCFKLQEVMDAFIESIDNYVPAKNHAVIRKAISYISQNYSQQLTLEDVAGHVHLNPSYFSSLFKQCTGSTFKEFLNIVRIEEGKHLLSNTDYSIIDIAVSLGFDNQSYFSKVFKKYTGLTPKQFRS